MKKIPRLLPPHTVKQIKQWNWTLWIQWIVANAVAWALALWTINKTYDILWNTVVKLSGTVGRPVMMALVGAVFGGIIGIAQRFVLRNTLRRSARWVVASAIGCALIWAIPWSVDRTIEKVLSGFLIGFVQWLVLRRQYRGYYWWIAASGLSWVAGDLVSRWIVYFPFPPEYQGIAGVASNGLAYGIISGFALTWLLQIANAKIRLRRISAPSKGIFIASWVIMNAIGWSIGFGSVGQLLRDTIIQYTGMGSHVVFEKASLECLSAVFVWFVLWRQWFRSSFWWVIWSSIGATAGLFAWTSLDMENATGIVAYGAIVGFFQWFILSQKLQGFFSWMVIRTGGWAGSLVVVSYMGKRLDNIDFGWGAGGLVYGLITGAWMLWQLRNKMSFVIQPVETEQVGEAA